MKTPLKLALAILLLAALGYAGFRLLDGPSETEDPRAQLGMDPEDTPQPADALSPAGGGPNAGERLDDPDTTLDPSAAASATIPDRPTRTEVTSGADNAQQGVHGVLIDSGRNPIGGAEVFLIEAATKDLLRSMMLIQAGIHPPPVARVVSDAYGRFSLPLQKPMPDQVYEIRAIHDRFADVSVPGMIVHPGEWLNAGHLSMTPGNHVYGQVTVAGSGGLPVAGATVFAKPIENLGSARATPGRESGIETITDSSGRFRFDNVKSGIVDLAAVAPGFAKFHLLGQIIRPENSNRFAFQLKPGLSIQGTLTDADGNPLSRAKVSATAISSKAPIAEETRSDIDGRFEILGLVAGPYRLVAFASGFVNAEIAPIQAGAEGQHIVLERQSTAMVRVVTKSGRLVRNYQLSLRKYFPRQEQLGNSPTNPSQLVTPRDVDKEGYFPFPGIDPGRYVFEVITRNSAKTYSEPFGISAASVPVLVEMVLAEGGKIRGKIRGPDGDPLSGVEVTTLPNYLDRSPLTALFGTMMPARVTQTTARTDDNGEFQLARLSSGDYQLEFSHPDYYTVNRKDLTVAEGQTTDFGELTLQRGTRVFGSVEHDGKPARHVKVNLASILSDDPQANRGSGRLVSGEAMTDADGLFEIPTRLPPGQYQAQAARQTLGNAMMQVLDFAATKREFRLAPGQDSLRLDFLIPATTLPAATDRGLGR